MSLQTVNNGWSFGSAKDILYPEAAYGFYSTMVGLLGQLKISCIQKLHIDFKQLTMVGPLSQLNKSCNQRMHMIFTFLLTGMGLELTSSRGGGPSIILTNFIGLVND